MSNPKYQNIEVYLDYATIPSLNYFLHFIENYEDKETIRLFGLGRFSLPSNIISAFPENKIFFEVAKVNEQDKFNQLFHNTIVKSESKINVNIHLNLFHSLQMLIPLLNTYSQFRDKFGSFHLNFYDDGSEGCVTLYHLTKLKNLNNIVINYKQQILELEKTKRLNTPNTEVLRYLWNNFVPSHYHLLDTSLLNKESLAYLKQEGLNGNVSKISFERYNLLSEEKKKLFLELLGINPNLENELKIMCSENKIFLFTGTTLFHSNDELDLIMARMHINAISHFMNENVKHFNGERYLFLYKGHPNSKKVDDLIKDKFENIIFIPNELSFEILYLLGMKPTKMGGFASSSYFNLRPDIITDMIFISHLDKTEREKNRLFYTQYELVEVLKELGYISNHQIYYHQQFI